MTFAAPASETSVSFGSSATVMTDVNGIAASPTMTANGQPRAFQVTASTKDSDFSNVCSDKYPASPANKLTFIQQPTDTAAGAEITPPGHSSVRR